MNELEYTIFFILLIIILSYIIIRKPYISNSDIEPSIDYFLFILEEYRRYNPSIVEEIERTMNTFNDIYERLVVYKVESRAQRYIDMAEELKRRTLILISSFVFTIPLDKRFLDTKRGLMTDYITGVLNRKISEMKDVFPLPIRINDTFRAYNYQVSELR